VTRVSQHSILGCVTHHCRPPVSQNTKSWDA